MRSRKLQNDNGLEAVGMVIFWYVIGITLVGTWSLLDQLAGFLLTCSFSTLTNWMN